MKRNILLISALIIAATSLAQHKLTPPVTIKAYEYLNLIARPGTIGPSINSTENSQQKTTVLITLEDGYTVEDLETYDYIEIESLLTSCIVAKVPTENLLELNEIAYIRRVELNKEMNMDLNYARPSGNVDDVVTGFSYEGSTLSFDGSGVVVGMMDTGLEANHLNFLNPDGSSRIQRLWHMYSNNGDANEYTPANISSFTTDTREESHATHVAGILGGSYKGNGKFAYMSKATATSATIKTDQPIPYYGVATGADLAFSVGELYTANILNGVKNIIDYAESVGKPVVVNLSLGHTTGPHDGTDTYSQELTKLGKRGIICMSAGNDGDANISIVKEIKESTGADSELRTILQGNSNDVINGYVDLWGTDDTVLNLQWGVFSKSAQTFTPFITIDRAFQQVEATSTTFTGNFNGSVSATSYIDSNNNRYEVYTSFRNVTAKNTDKVIALCVTGAKIGQKLYLYSSTRNLTFSYKPSASASIVPGYTNGSPENSINDGACAKNVIVVGAYVSRTTCGLLQEGYYYPAATGYSVGKIAPFSSYGTAFDGTKLPNVAAPGARIVSSYSRFYSALNANNMTATAVNGSVSDYWGTMNGTSMSCPFVTGTVGLWLQADPTLDFDHVMDVINNTSAKQLTSTGRWGAGKIDALKGIQYVLDNRAALGQVWADDNQRLIITPTGAGYDVFVADGGDLTVTLYDLQGRPVAVAKGADGSVTVDAPALAHGVYVLEARGADYRLTRKMTR